jgi:hypothetical protein
VDLRSILLLVAVVCLSAYVIGIGGATAAAIRAAESWRRRKAAAPSLDAKAGGEVLLEAPTLSAAARRLRLAGWIAFVPALALGVFANSTFTWLAPVVVILTVALNGFYFASMQGLGERLVLAKDGFRTGTGKSERAVKWIHITDLTGARLGAFSAMRMSEKGEWQDPKLRPNVIFYRVNRALVRQRKSIWQRLTGLSYFDGVIRNAFGVPTDQLLHAMRERQRLAIEADGPLGRRAR